MCAFQNKALGTHPKLLSDAPSSNVSIEADRTVQLVIKQTNTKPSDCLVKLYAFRSPRSTSTTLYLLLHRQLHTLEDYSAHSNFCELALVSMGHEQVFVHVGDQVRIQAPNGKRVAPIVTGSFGSSDFIHSLLGGTLNQPSFL